jgi:hypothetical protein
MEKGQRTGKRRGVKGWKGAKGGEEREGRKREQVEE